ncbi:peptidase family M3 [Ilyonectria destructans]|nr:peptidase family M3 [Ilyonectria destructans]
MTSIPPQPLPRLISAEEMIPNAKKILAEFRHVRNSIAKNVVPSIACFDNVIKPLIDVDNRTQGDLQVMTMLRYASPDKAAREASDEAVRLISECDAEFTARTDLFTLIKAVKDKDEPLDFEASKYLDKLIKDFSRCGHGALDEGDINCYLDRRNEIDNLRRQYNRNVREENGGIWFSLEALDGLSSQDVSRFEEGTNSDQERMRFIRHRRVNFENIMKYARNPLTRKRMYVSDAYKLRENLDLFKDVITKRDENARLLGYGSHASFRLENRVAKTADWVINFFSQLADTLLPQGESEMQLLLEVKKKYLTENTDYPQDYPDAMPPWDYAFYSRIALEAFQVDHVKISEYFPLNHTVAAMLDLFTSCLQIRFIPIPSEALDGFRWHEDVEAWSVWDESEPTQSGFIGYLYMDLLWRPNKYPGAQNVTLQCSYLKDDGTRVYPATILMCGFPRPTDSGCALLKHHEVVTLFHELGHGIHDLVSRTSYAAFHGHRSPPDFAEAPSVMLENWCWMKDELKRMSCHFTNLDSGLLRNWQKNHPGEEVPPEQIPNELLDSLVRSRKHNRALWYLRQLALSQFDMAVHNVPSHEECYSLNPGSMYNDLMEKYTFLTNPEPQDRGHPHTDFGHLFSGYDAGYYSYLAAHVFAADIFQTTFAKDPGSQAAWEKYRRGILQYGGSRDELEMLEEFLGHPVSPKALFQSLEL